jgi:hypothetical protein
MIPSPKAQDSGIFNAAASTKTMFTMQQQLFLLPAGKLQIGETKVPFEFLVKANNVGDPGVEPNVTFAGKLFETYRGVYINVQYSIKLRLSRGLMSKDDVLTQEFAVVCPTSQNVMLDASRLVYKLTPSSLINVKASLQMARVLIFLFVFRRIVVCRISYLRVSWILTLGISRVQ